MKPLGNSQFLSDDITRNFYSFYDFSTVFNSDFGDYTVYDQINNNNLTGGFSSGYGAYGKGGKFNGFYVSTIIDYPVLSFPYFLFSSIQTTASGGIIGLQPRQDWYPSNYLEHGGFEFGYVSGIATAYTTYNNSSIYRISDNMNVSGKVLNMALIVRAHDNFSVYVNGSKGSIATSNGGSPSLTPMQQFSVGHSYPYGSANGTMFFAGYGVKDPGDPFFKILTANPLKTIFQRQSFKNAQWTRSPIFRRSFSTFGTRIGSRGTNV